LSGTLFSSLHFQRLFLATIMTTTSNDLLTALIPTIPPSLLFSTTIHGSRCLLHNTTVYIIITRALIHTRGNMTIEASADPRNPISDTTFGNLATHLSVWLVTSSKPSIVAGGFVPAANTSGPDRAFSPSPRQTFGGGCGEQPWKWPESCCFIRQRRQTAFRPLGSVTRTGHCLTGLLGKSGSTFYYGINASVTIVLLLRSLPCTSRPTRSTGSSFSVQIRYLGPTITLSTHPAIYIHIRNYTPSSV
jgi:hypothetical protein